MEYAAFLQSAMSMSAYNYKLKLDLLRVCGILGDGPTALGVWNNLGVKHIQVSPCAPCLHFAWVWLGYANQCASVILTCDVSRIHVGRDPDYTFLFS